MIINQPEELLAVQCYKCKKIMNVHPMSNINSEYFKECSIHNLCEHESDGMIYTSNPPQNKCKKCGEFYK